MMQKRYKIFYLVVFISFVMCGCGTLYNEDRGINPYKQDIIDAIAPDSITLARTADQNNHHTGNFVALNWDLK